MYDNSRQNERVGYRRASWIISMATILFDKFHLYFNESDRKTLYKLSPSIKSRLRWPNNTRTIPVSISLFGLENALTAYIRALSFRGFCVVAFENLL